MSRRKPPPLSPFPLATPACCRHFAYKTYLQRRLSQPGQRTAATGSSAGSSLCQLLQLELFGQMFEESWRAASKREGGEGIPRGSYTRAQVTQAAHCTRCNQLPLMNSTCSSSGNVCIPIRAFPFTLTLQLACAPRPFLLHLADPPPFSLAFKISCKKKKETTLRLAKWFAC